MKIEIKNKINGKIILCGEYESVADCINKNSSADLSYADLSYADLSSADLSSADLSSADLRSADLSSADLRYADLSSADLRSADLFGEKIVKIPLMIYGLKYDIFITEKHIKIGCEVHEAKEWKKFDDKRILQMEGRAALNWWKENKKFIMCCHKKHIT